MDENHRIISFVFVQEQTKYKVLDEKNGSKNGRKKCKK